MRSGHTLLETAIVLAVMAVAAALVLPPMRGWGDQMAVAAAREAVAGMVAEARVLGMGRGGATVSLVASRGFLATVIEGDTIRLLDLHEAFQVDVGVSGRSDRIDLSFDDLGLGRVASRTFSFHRGGRSTRLVVSSYGRVRRP